MNPLTNGITKPVMSNVILGSEIGIETLESLYKSKLGFAPSYDHPGGAFPSSFTRDDFTILETQDNPDVDIVDNAFVKTGADTSRFLARFSISPAIPAGSRVEFVARKSGLANWIVFFQGGNPAPKRPFEDEDIYFADAVTLTADLSEIRIQVNNETELGSLSEISLRVVEPSLQDYDIIIGAGQSGMAGNSSGTFPDADIDQPDDRIYVRETMFDGSLARTEGGINTAVSPIKHYNPGSDGVGLLMEFARYYAENIMQPGRKVLLLPFARGATSLTGTNNPSWNVSALTGTPIYDCLVDLVSVMGSVQSEIGAGSKFVAFFWNHGESDDSTAGRAAYPTDFSNLVTRIRTEAAEPNLPVVIAGLNPDPLGGYDQMIALQEKLAFDSGDVTAIARCIHTAYSDEWPSGTVSDPLDNTHKTSAANRLHAVQCAIDFEAFLIANP